MCFLYLFSCLEGKNKGFGVGLKAKRAKNGERASCRTYVGWKHLMSISTYPIFKPRKPTPECSTPICQPRKPTRDAPSGSHKGVSHICKPCTTYMRSMHGIASYVHISCIVPSSNNKSPFFQFWKEIWLFSQGCDFVPPKPNLGLKTILGEEIYHLRASNLRKKARLDKRKLLRR